MTAKILRNPQRFSESTYDTIIIGGGIYGAMLLLEAARKGLSALMIERHDFGSGTTANNFRILHGGLRSLQSGDLRRYRESVAERSWFLRTFPELVEPMRCLMPYYGQGAKRTSVLKLVSVINDMLSADRNSDLRADRKLGPTSVISRDQTIQEFPLANEAGLQGGLIWHDAKMPDCHRILIEIIRWACEYNARALNYVVVSGLITEGNTTAGVRASDLVSGDELEFRSKTVICAAGPWTTGIPVEGGIPPRHYFPSRAWNVLLDRAPICDGAVAVSPPIPGGQLYFIHSYGSKLFVGTGHSTMSEKSDPEENTFPEILLEGFLADINRAIPGLELNSSDILQVFEGFLPVRRANSVQLLRNSTIRNFGEKHGQKGLYIVVGVKFTTARSTASAVIDKICRRHFPAARSVQVFDNKPRQISRYKLRSVSDDGLLLANELADAESVIKLDDLLLRRMGLQENLMELEPMRRKLQENSVFMSRIED